MTFDEVAGKCSAYGHTYFVNLTIAGDTFDHNGFLVNFGGETIVIANLIIIYLMIYRNLKALFYRNRYLIFMKWFKLR